MLPDLGHNGGAKGHVRDEMALSAVQTCSNTIKLIPAFPAAWEVDEGSRTKIEEVLQCHCYLPSMMSTWIQSEFFSMMSEQAFPSSAKSADRIEGAIMAGGVMLAVNNRYHFLGKALDIANGRLSLGE